MSREDRYLVEKYWLSGIGGLHIFVHCIDFLVRELE
jgi:hypothetical protein